MKSSRHNRKKAAQGTLTGDTGSSPRKSPRRQRYLKIAAMALPIVGLLLLELALRLAGYGYPTRFFQRQQFEGQSVLTDNPQFGRRFFPPAMVRTPPSLAVPEEKPRGTIRIMVLGESAAMGDPEMAFGFARVLEVLLTAAYPDTRFEVVNAAMTAINSHAVLQIARDARPLQADYWVIYMGNNEVVGPFGSGTVFGPRAPSLAAIRASLLLKTTKTGQWLDSVAARLHPQTPRQWEGMEMFLHQQMPAGDPQMEVVYRHFEQNYADILRAAKAAKARVVMCSVGANLKDCAPFASQHRSGMTAAELAQFNQAMTAGTAALSASNYVEARQQFQAAVKMDGEHAEAHYFLAESLWALGLAEPAKIAYEAARHWDTLRFRVDARLNETIRKLGRQAAPAEIKLLDAEQALASASPHGVPGREFFWEHVHLNFEGNYLLAKAVAQSLTGWIAATNRRPAWLTTAQTAEQLALTEWERFRMTEIMHERLKAAPFTNQANHSREVAVLSNQLATLRAQVRPAALRLLRPRYEAAAAKRTNDWMIAAKHAELLEEIGDLPAAVEQWRRAGQFLPHDAVIPYHLGSLLDKQGQSDMAIPHLQEALRRKPNFAEARAGLGICQLNLGQAEEAVRQLEAALALNPDYAEAMVSLALAYSRQEKSAEAKRWLQEALRRRPGLAAAHINYGKLLKSEGRLEDAIEQYQAALAAAPDDPIAHFNLANTLGSLKRHPEALPHYAAAVEADPGFLEARLGYAMGLERAGQSTQALEQFRHAATQATNAFDARFNLGIALARRQEYLAASHELAAAVTLRPESPEAHFTLGTVLSQLAQWASAQREFEATLRLEPANAAARSRLEAVRRAQGQ